MQTSNWRRVGPQFFGQREGVVEGNFVSVCQDVEPRFLVEPDSRLVPGREHGHIGPSEAKEQLAACVDVMDDVADDKRPPESDEELPPLLAEGAGRIHIKPDRHRGSIVAVWTGRRQFKNLGCESN